MFFSEELVDARLPNNRTSPAFRIFPFAFQRALLTTPNLRNLPIR